jgi:pyruvate oxidase
VTVSALLERLPADGRWLDRRAELAERWAAWREEKQTREERDNGAGVNSAVVFAHLADAVPRTPSPASTWATTPTPSDATSSAGASRSSRPGYLGSIGFAFPAAMGAWAAGTGRTVVSVSGDGGFGQYMGELTSSTTWTSRTCCSTTASLARSPKSSGTGSGRSGRPLCNNPSFADYARLCGAAGWRVENEGDLPGVLAAAVHTRGPSLVEVIADPLLT